MTLSENGVGGKRHLHLSTGILSEVLIVFVVLGAMWRRLNTDSRINETGMDLKMIF